ncbi:DUF4386 domain-containing protein [Croceimicrobium hydrocarbonivorans]|uniref:DUF4386 domain-containing protein n=1 Tax=Croceimicrobium hydrocarbonivorans TaxID=2761580 RepID=A0A7H0VE01_9FLAO|nr:DUF4386 domain-containing protein [Croceimicrobium hydrocarbonivorans]QNR23949.1 DUF4386 domain-containing protein [Croceimicrobium hydrocarbonivorans]
MQSRGHYARWAGISFLALFIFGFYGMGYVPNTLFDYGNAEHSYQQIAAKGLLHRQGIIATVFMNIASIFLALFSYLWLGQFSKSLALSTAILLSCGAFISLGNELNSYALNYWSQQSFSPQVAGQISFYLNQYRFGVYLATVFWGLWLIPPGIALILKRGLARIIGLLLVLSALGYLIDSLAYLAQDKLLLVADYTFLGELSFTLYMLFQKKARY